MALEQYLKTFNSYLVERFGRRVARLTIDTGIPCPWMKCSFCRHDTFVPFGTVNMSVAGWEKIAAEAMTRLEKRYDTNLFFAYFQNGTSTYGDRELLSAMYAAATRIPGVVGLIISTRPDHITTEIVETILQSIPDGMNEVWIELGLQSVFDTSLTLLNRGHNAADYFKALDIIYNNGKGKIRVAPHLILGIPGETEEEMAASARKAVAHVVVGAVKLHHLQVYHNTPLADLYAKHPFPLLSADQYIAAVARILTGMPAHIVFFRLFATSPHRYLIGPNWNLSTQEILEKLEEYCKKHTIKQAMEARI